MRAKERYDLVLTESDLEDILELICENHGKVIGYMEEGRTVWKLKWRDLWMRVVVDKDFTDIITFLPKTGPVKLRPSETYRKRA